MKEYFTLEECMEQLGLKRSAILKRLKEGELEFMDGKGPLPPMNDFNEEAILNENEEPESP